MSEIAKKGDTIESCLCQGRHVVVLSGCNGVSIKSDEENYLSYTFIRHDQYIIVSTITAALSDPNFKSAEVDQQHKCEADKPEGTRNVDKFLREQQARIWGNGD